MAGVGVRTSNQRLIWWFLICWAGLHVLSMLLVVSVGDGQLSGGICRVTDSTTALGDLARAVSALANPVPVTVVAGLSAGVALILRQWCPAVVLLAVPYLASFTSGLIKDAFARSRPSFDCVAGFDWGYSFPSGHAVGASTGFVLVAVWVAGKLPSRFVLVVCVSAAVLVECVAWSRVALGAHYVTDILAGQIWGALWTALGIALFGIAPYGSRIGSMMSGQAHGLRDRHTP